MVRTMKSQNGALDLFVSRVASSDVGKVQVKPDSLSMLSKPASEDFRESILSCNVPHKGSRKLETSLVPLHREGQGRVLSGA